MRNFSRLIKDHYERTPEKVSVVFLQNGQEDHPVTYQALVDGAVGYAATLKKAGIQPDDVVIIILQHGVDLLFAYFGTILYGAIPSIMPFLTDRLLPEHYRADLAALIAVTEPTGIITYRDFEKEVRAALRPGEDAVKAVIITDQVEKPSPPVFRELKGLERLPEDIALLQHSSGTTGLKKGVALSHRAVIKQLENYSKAIGLNEKDVFISWLPLYHDMGLIACWLMPILLGFPLILLSPFDWVRAPYRLFQAVTRFKGTLTWLPNFSYNFCAQKIRDRDLEGVDLSSWRAVSNCSEPMRWESHQVFYERFGKLGLRYDSLKTCYAMAENVFAVTQGGMRDAVVYEDIDRDKLQFERKAIPADPDRSSTRMLSAGKTIPGTELCILGDGGVALSDRHVGEIAIKSDYLLTEYYHRADATADAFSQGWYLTGDFGYLVNGELYITGRKKDLIIVGGKNIFPQDLEEIAYTVPGVYPGRSSAFGIYNDASGTEDVVLVVETDAQNKEERQRIADNVRNVVTRGSAVALRYVYIVDRHWMVKTSSGKTARSANREKFIKEMNEKGEKY